VQAAAEELLPLEEGEGGAGVKKQLVEEVQVEQQVEQVVVVVVVVEVQVEQVE